MITFEVDVEDGVSPTLRTLIGALSGAERVELNEVGGRGATNAAKVFHMEFDSQGGWRGPRSFGSGKSDFGAAVAAGWHYVASDPESTTIANNAEHYGFKVSGGTITPKRVKFLTIPLIAEAHGRRAKDYQSFSGNRLFRPKGKFILAEKDGKGLRAVYALKESVTQRPWPDAVPPESVIADAFVHAWGDALADKL